MCKMMICYDRSINQCRVNFLGGGCSFVFKTLVDKQKR